MTLNGAAVINNVLYGGTDEALPLRLWDATTDGPWRIEHLGISALGIFGVSRINPGQNAVDLTLTNPGYVD